MRCCSLNCSGVAAVATAAGAESTASATDPAY